MTPHKNVPVEASDILKLMVGHTILSARETDSGTAVVFIENGRDFEFFPFNGHHGVALTEQMLQ